MRSRSGICSMAVAEFNRTGTGTLVFSVFLAEFMSITPRPDWLQKLEIERKAVPRRDCAELLFRNKTSMYDCLLVAFQEHPEVSGEYHANLQTWLGVYPPGRFHVVQVSLRQVVV